MATPLILSGKEVSTAVYAELEGRISALRSKNIIPNLGVIIAGNDPASKVYVRSKTRRFESLGLLSETLEFPENVKPAELLSQINRWNQDESIHGILVQLPLPDRLNEEAVILQVDPKKDVDGFHPMNMGFLATGKPRFIPCTPKGILRILKHYGIKTEGKHVVVLGRSNIVGRPISILAGLKGPDGNATVTVCHSRTPDIKEISRIADILVAGLGVPEFVKGDFLKPGAVVIDVGINRVEDNSDKGYRLTGDVKFDEALDVVSAITPVPGGVGPMTIAMLVENTVQSAENLLI